MQLRLSSIERGRRVYQSGRIYQFSGESEMKEEKKVLLRKKGWNEQEILKAEKILEREEHHDVFFSKIVFWSALIVIIFANLVVSLILIPFLIVLKQGVLYSVIVLLAGTIGFLYNFLITDIGHLKRKHHVLAGIIVPSLALANFIIMVVVANQFIANLPVENQPHDPWIIGIIFAATFILPYLLGKMRMIRKKRKAVMA